MAAAATSARPPGAGSRRRRSDSTCPTCDGRGYVGEQLHFWSQDAENEHRVNEAIVRAAAALYLRRWPAGSG
jgi:hypothetical protein